MCDKALFLTPIYDPYVGGAAVHFKQLSEGLVDQGAIDSFVIISAYSSEAPIFESRSSGQIFRVLFSPSSIHRRLSKPKIAANYIFSIFFTIISHLIFQVSIVHSHTKRYFSISIEISKLFESKVIIDGRDLGAPLFSPTGDVFVAASENIAKKATNRDERIVQIPIGIDPDELTVDCSNVSTPSEQYLLFVGDITDRKGVPELLAAYESNQFDRKLLLIGEWIDQDIDIEGVGGVQYLGPKTHSKVLCYIRDADLVVLPSKEEGLPRVVLESVFHNTPVLCPPVVPEFQHYIPDITLSAIEPIEIQKTIKQIFDEDLSADNYPLKKHQVSNVVSRYSSLYASLNDDHENPYTD